MGQVEQQMQGLQAALEAGAAVSAALEATNATLVAERLAAGTVAVMCPSGHKQTGWHPFLLAAIARHSGSLALIIATASQPRISEPQAESQRQLFPA